MLLQTDLILLLRYPEPPKPPETPQAKQFAHLPVEADNLKSKRHFKRLMHLEGHQKVPFCLNSPLVWRPECFSFPSNLFSALCHRPQIQRVQQTHLVTSLGQDTKGSALTGGMKPSPGGLQAPHHAAWGLLGPARSCPGSCRGAASSGAWSEEQPWLVISHAWMGIRSVQVCSGVCTVKSLDNLVGRGEN